MNMNKLVKRLATLGIALAIGVTCIGCGNSKNAGSSSETSAKSDSSTSDKDELVIGFDDTFVPMGFKDESGEIVGFDVDLAKAVSEKLNKKIKFQAIDWSMKETELNGGNIDLIWNGYSINDERKEKVEFSKPYLNNTQIIVTLADSSINTKADLAGKKVGAQNESTAVDAVEADGNIMSTFDGGSLITFEDNNQALMDLEAGRLDAIVVDEILARYYIKARGEGKYKILTENFGNEQYAVGIRKDDTKFVEEFNKALDEVINDGEAAEISKKWFDEDIIVK
ncbi:amino acid ABC transporter substrate-binding protein [uncultured Clostridium sp.]|uniref:amino acid ABC transporter substrate-binding protein n=1 Tax=uncultured Clostridium sp. TaxID=59620 RepID=UPI0025F6B9D6|nr:amino acid ABC transporter substrate-binding protein [uncultured Clostridium sp.]